VTEEKDHKNKCCENCLFGTDYGESVRYIKCERNKRKWVDKKQPGCKNYADKE